MINVDRWGGSPDPRATPWSRSKSGRGAGLRTRASAPHWATKTVKPFQQELYGSASREPPAWEGQQKTARRHRGDKKATPRQTLRKRQRHRRERQRQK